MAVQSRFLMGGAGSARRSAPVLVRSPARRAVAPVRARRRAASRCTALDVSGFRFPRAVGGGGKGKWETGWSGRELVASGGLDDTAGLGELGEGLAEGGGTHVTGAAKPGERDRVCGVSEHLLDLVQG